MLRRIEPRSSKPVLEDRPGEGQRHARPAAGWRRAWSPGWAARSRRIQGQQVEETRKGQVAGGQAGQDPAVSGWRGSHAWVLAVQADDQCRGRRRSSPAADQPAAARSRSAMRSWTAVARLFRKPCCRRGRCLNRGGKTSKRGARQRRSSGSEAGRARRSSRRLREDQRRGGQSEGRARSSLRQEVHQEDRPSDRARIDQSVESGLAISKRVAEASAPEVEIAVAFAFDGP